MSFEMNKDWKDQVVSEWYVWWSWCPLHHVDIFTYTNTNLSFYPHLIAAAAICWVYSGIEAGLHFILNSRVAPSVKICFFHLSHAYPTLKCEQVKSIISYLHRHCWFCHLNVTRTWPFQTKTTKFCFYQCNSEVCLFYFTASLCVCCSAQSPLSHQRFWVHLALQTPERKLRNCCTFKSDMFWIDFKSSSHLFSRVDGKRCSNMLCAIKCSGWSCKRHSLSSVKCARVKSPGIVVPSHFS